MLRKRTSFKPNLQKVTQQQQPQQQQNINHGASNNSTNASITPEQPKQPQLEQLDPLKTNEPSNIIIDEHLQKHQQQTEKDKTVNLSNQKVQDAITQLTGQKFEPIKSLSLRSSVNKNVKLKDLLFFNPPMTKDQKRHKKSVILAKKNEKKKVQEESEATTTATKSDNEDNNESNFGPKVKMGPEGKLILDESSTIINRKNSIKEKEAIIEDNEDIISRTNYDSFRRRPTNVSQTKWSNDDTQKFYQALTILGTDFSMMESLLFSGTRSRTELHKKFKREERVNKLKVDIALSNRISLNSEELEDLKEVFYDH